MGCFSAPEFCPEGVTVLNSVGAKRTGSQYWSVCVINNYILKIAQMISKVQRRLPFTQTIRVEMLCIYKPLICKIWCGGRTTRYKVYPKQMNRLKRLEKLHRLKLQPMPCLVKLPKQNCTKLKTRSFHESVLTTLDRLSLGLMRSISIPVNPLSPNIHKQILQTDLYTFL